MPTVPKNPFENLFGGEAEKKQVIQQPTTKTNIPANPFEGLFEAKKETAAPAQQRELDQFGFPKTYISAAPEGTKIAKPEKKESFWTKAAKAILPKKLEDFFGLNEPDIKKEMKQKYEEAYAYEDLQRLQGQLEKGGGKLPTETAAEVFKETKPEQYLPFISDISNAIEAVQLKQSVDRLARGEETMVDLYRLTKARAEQEQDQTFGAKVATILTLLPSFGGELLLTGGIYTAGKKATQKTIQESLEKALGKKAGGIVARSAGAIVGGTLQTIPARGLAITAGTIQNMIPDYNFTKNELNQIYPEIVGEGDDLWKALAKSGANQWVEVVTEHSGGLLDELTTPLKNQLLKIGIVKSFLKANPTKTVTNFMTLVKRAGWNGILGEMFEERVGEVARGILSEFGLSEEGWVIPSKEQLAVELVSFSVPGAMINISNKVISAQGKTLEDMVNEPAPDYTTGKVPITEAEKIVGARDILAVARGGTIVDPNEIAYYQKINDAYEDSMRTPVIEIMDKDNETTLAEIEVIPYPDGKWGYSYNLNTAENGIYSGFLENKLVKTRAEAVEAAQKEVLAYINQQIANVTDEVKDEFNDIKSQIEKVNPNLEVSIQVRREEKPTEKETEEIKTKAVEEEIKPEIPEKLKPLENLAKMTSKERFRSIIHGVVESKTRTPLDQRLVDLLPYLEELKLPSPAIENFWELVRKEEIKPPEEKEKPPAKEEVKKEKKEEVEKEEAKEKPEEKLKPKENIKSKLLSLIKKDFSPLNATRFVELENQYGIDNVRMALLDLQKEGKVEVNWEMGAVGSVRLKPEEVEQGETKLIKAYHGTPRELEEIGFGEGIRSNKFLGTYYKVKSGAIFFTPNKEVAEFFAKNRAEYLQDIGEKGIKPTVYERFLDIKNPIDLTTMEKANTSLLDAGIDLGKTKLAFYSAEEEPNDFETFAAMHYDSNEEALQDLWRLFDDIEVVKKLQKAGYDGAILKETGGRGISYAIFNPKQALTAEEVKEKPETAKEEVKPEEVKPEEVTKPIPKELEPLAEEARKYKSAENFVATLKEDFLKLENAELLAREEYFNQIKEIGYYQKEFETILRKIKKPLTTKLDNLIVNTENRKILKPVLDTPVKFEWGRQKAYKGLYENKEITIHLPENITKIDKNAVEDIKKTILHEAQHALRDKLGRKMEWAPIEKGAENFSKFALKRELADFYNQAIKGIKTKPEVKPAEKVKPEAQPTPKIAPEAPKPPTPVREIKPIPPELEPLAKEARKYKSAEEFVEAQGISVYHGTSAKFEPENIKEGTYVTPDKEYAGVYQSPSASSLTVSDEQMANKLSGEKRIIEYILPKNAKIFDATNPNHLRLLDDYWKTESMSGEFIPTETGQLDWTEIEGVADYLKKKGYKFDAIKVGEGGGITPEGFELKRADSLKILNPKILKTKSQLIDIWEKANKKLSKPETITETKPEIEEKKPRLAKKPTEPVIGKKIVPATEFASKLITKKPVLPILGEFQVKDGKLFATDLDVAIRLNTTLKDGMYKLVGKEAVKTDTNPDEFPILPDIQGTPIIKTTSETLVKTLKAAALSVSNSSARPEIMGVYIKSTGNIVEVVSTDSFRLYYKRMPAEVLDKGQFILAEIKKVNKLVEAAGDVVEITADERNAKISGNNGDIMVRLIQGEFPDYREVYPSYSIQYEFDKKQFLNTLKELKPFTDKLYHKVEMRFADNKVTLIANNQIDNLHKEVELKITQRKIDVKEKVVNEGVLVMPIQNEESEENPIYNLNYLVDAVNAIEGDLLEFNLNGKDPTHTPVLITDYRDLKTTEPAEAKEEAKKPRFAKEKPVEEKGVYGFNPKNLEDLDSPQAIKETDKITKRSEIARQLSEKLNVPIRRGKFRRPGAIGIFKEEQRVVRVKSGGLSTIFHEVGHFLDLQFGFSKEINPTERKALMKEYAFKYTGQKEKQQKEAFAEFLRFRMTGQNEKALLYAPKFSAYFDKRMGELPEINEVIQTATKDFIRWQEQPAVAKVLSQISIGSEREGRFADTVKTKAHQLYTAGKDALHPIAEFVKLGERVLERPIPAEQNPYILARNLRGWVGKANTFLEKGTFGKKYWEVVDGKVKPVFKGKSFAEIIKPIEDAGKTDEFRVYLVAARTIELAKRNIKTGISQQDAQAAFEELEAKNPEFKEVADDLYQYQNDLLDYAIENGLIGTEIGNKMKELNKFRVPFYRVFEEIKSSYMGGKKIAGNLPNVIKKIKGSEREIIDPLESIVKDTYAIINAAERNNVGIAMAHLASQHFELGRLFEEVDQPVKATNINVKEVLEKASPELTELIPDDLANKIVTIFRPTQDRGNNMININIGDEYLVFQADHDLYMALQGLNVEDVGMIMRILSTPARLLRAGATLTPDFSIRNPMRDQMTAFVYSKYGFIPGIDFVKGIFELVNKGDVYNLWRMGGGEHSMLVSMDRTYLQKTFKEIVRSKGGLFFKYVKNPMELLRAMSEFGEKATRLGEAKRALDALASPIETAYTSREVTLDFARVGAKTKAINSIIAFWNANLEGLDRMVRAFNEKPLRTSFRVFMGITLPSILLYLANRDDDRWKEIPQWQKDLFWIIMTKNHIYRIPKPFELGILFGSVPERILEYLDNQDEKLIDELVKSIMNGASPGIVPTFLEPVIENITNYSFFLGRPIVARGKEALPPEAQYGTYTSEVAKILGKVLNYSPSKIDNLIQGYTGGLGKYAVNAIDKILEGTGIVQTPIAPALMAEEYPVFKSFMIRPPIGSSSESVDRVYDLYSETTAQMSYIKDLVEGNEIDRAKELVKKYPYVEYTTLLRATISTFSDINTARDEIRRSETLSAEEKRDKIKQLDELQTKVAQEVLKQIKQGK